MSDYVPTTEQVRNNMAFGAACAWVALHGPDEAMEKALRDLDWPVPYLRTGVKAQFDAWLAEHDAQVAAKALRNAATDLPDAMTRQADAPEDSPS